MKILKYLLLYSLIGLVTSGCVATMPLNEKEEKRVAFVLGNDEYPVLKKQYNEGTLSQDPTLTKAVTDARNMRDKLVMLGFRVHYGENLDLKDMETMLNNFTRDIDKDTLAFVYYSGHGASDAKQLNYLIPSDFSGKEALAVDKIAFTMKSKNSSQNILALDMCRNNGVSIGEKGSKALGKGDIAIDSPYNQHNYKDDGLLISYATGQNNQANEGDMSIENSLYTHFLLQHLDDETLSLSDLFGKVNKEVVNASNRKQNPWKNGSLEGNDIFLAKKKARPDPPPRP